MKSNKFTHLSNDSFQINGQNGQVLAAYIAKNDIDVDNLIQFLSTIDFVRVRYVSQYSKANRTPRLTWTWAHSKANRINLSYNSDSNNIYDKLRMVSNPNPPQTIVNFKGLNFYAEAMPPVLEKLSMYCRLTAIQNYGFDPCYNSVIIGKYLDGTDEIGFHRDDESFLAHTFCANITLGHSRDFQFRIDPEHLNKNPLTHEIPTRETHEVSLGHTSLFFFSGLEHALPKRAGHTVDQGVRYSISFRNMETDVGVGNSMYYCRGVDGAINDQRKGDYITKLHRLQIERYGSVEAANNN
jgi:hypothetical protein